MSDSTLFESMSIVDDNQEAYNRFTDEKNLKFKSRLIRLNERGEPLNGNWRTQTESDKYVEGAYYGVVPLSLNRLVIDFVGKEGIKDYERFVRDQFPYNEFEKNKNKKNRARWNYLERYGIVKYNSNNEKFGGTVCLRFNRELKDKVKEKQEKYPHLRFLHSGNGFFFLYDQTINGIDHCFVSFKEEGASVDHNKLELIRTGLDISQSSYVKQIQYGDFSEVLSYIEFDKISETRVAFALLDTQLSFSDAKRLYINWAASKNNGKFQLNVHEEYFNSLSCKNQKRQGSLRGKQYNIGFIAILSWALEYYPTNTAIHNIRKRHDFIKDEDLELGTMYCRFYVRTKNSRAVLYDTMYKDDKGAKVSITHLELHLCEVKERIRRVYSCGVSPSYIVSNLTVAGFIKPLMDFMFIPSNPKLLFVDEEGNFYMNANVR